MIFSCSGGPENAWTLLMWWKGPENTMMPIVATMRIPIAHPTISTLLSSISIASLRRSILRAHDRLQIATRIPLGDDAGVSGPDRRDEVIQDLIGHRFMKDIRIAITIEIELE